MEQDGYIQFKQGLPFYDMVMGFMTSLSLVSFILNNENLLELKEKDYVNFNGKWVKPRHFFPHDVVSNIKSGKYSLQSYVNSSCCMLANSAYESVKNDNDKSPEFEFLRHIRNASSHQNKFMFYSSEPTLPAYWNGAVIDHTMKGNKNPLDDEDCFGSFFGVSDIIDLLKEIEDKMI